MRRDLLDVDHDQKIGAQSKALSAHLKEIGINDK